MVLPRPSRGPLVQGGGKVLVARCRAHWLPPAVCAVWLLVACRHCACVLQRCAASVKLAFCVGMVFGSCNSFSEGWISKTTVETPTERFTTTYPLTVRDVCALRSRLPRCLLGRARLHAPRDRIGRAHSDMREHVGSTRASAVLSACMCPEVRL